LFTQDEDGLIVNLTTNITLQHPINCSGYAASSKIWNYDY